MALADDEVGKPIWDAEIQVKEGNEAKKKNVEPSGLCEIFSKILIGILMGAVVLIISVIENVSFATMAHRDSTFGVTVEGALSHVGLEGVSHMGFLFAMIIPDIRSFFYSAHFWIFRGARFPLKTFKLWIPAVLSECIYAGGQGLFIFFVAPYLEDSTMILGSFLVLTVPIILSIIFPEYRYTSWDFETQSFSEEKQLAYAKRKRVVYGIALVFNIAGFVFFCLEIVNNPISDDYWNLIEQIDGSTCRDTCRAGMAVAAFFLMSLSSWLNYINDNHENTAFGHAAIQNFKEAKTRELQIFPVYTISALFRIAINVSIWLFRERRVDKFAGDCDATTNVVFGNPTSHLKFEYMNGSQNVPKYRLLEYNVLKRDPFKILTVRITLN